MIIWTPVGNSTDVCAGITAYEASRPPLPPTSHDTVIAMYTLFALANLVCAYVLFKHRNQTLFRKVRPLLLNGFCLVGMLICSITFLLNPSVKMPCWIMLLSLLLGMCFLAINIFLKLLIFSIESQYAQLSKKFNLRINDETQSEFSSSAMSTSPAEVMYAIVLVGFGLGRVDNMSLQQLVIAKNSYWLILMGTFLPGAIPFAVVLAVIPQYQVCEACSIFADAIVAYMCTFALYLIGLIAMVCNTRNFPDTTGVKAEILVSVIAVAPFTLSGLVLVILDPEELSFQRTFAWEWLSFIGVVFFWIVSIVVPLIHSTKQYKPRNQQPLVEISSLQQSSAKSTNSLLLQGRKEEFETFMTERYALENLHFVEDVKNYVGMYFEKNERWRLIKAKLLYVTYIAPGAVMEVNISSADKRAIDLALERAEKLHAENPTALLKLDTLFDEAVRDIEMNVLAELVTSFNNNPKRDTGGMVTRNTPGVKGNTLESQSSLRDLVSPHDSTLAGQAKASTGSMRWMQQ